MATGKNEEAEHQAAEARKGEERVARAPHGTASHREPPAGERSLRAATDETDDEAAQARAAASGPARDGGHEEPGEGPEADAAAGRAERRPGHGPLATAANPGTRDPRDKRDKREKAKGNNVRKIRMERMMSKAELARRAAVSTLTIDRVERGLPCRMDTKRKILEALGLHPTDRVMVFGEDD
jgi:DNA-binding XRE family transcriptional regulator